LSGRPDYRAHEVLVAPARAYDQLWRLLVGVFVAGIVYVTLNQVFFASVYTLFGARSEILHQQMVAGSTPLAVIVFLISFGMIIPATGLAARVMHQRPLRSVLGPWPVLGAQFVRVCALLILLNVVLAILPPWGMGEGLTANLSFGPWVAILPFSILALLIQVGAEEVFFRGYVQQQLAARFQSPLIWMIVPSGLFGLLHYQPDMLGDNAMMVAVWATVFGVLMADLTARAGTLGPAIAVHLVNNVLALVFVAVPDQMSGLALYLTPFGFSDVDAVRDWLLVDFAAMFVAWLAARLAIRR